MLWRILFSPPVSNNKKASLNCSSLTASVLRKPLTETESSVCSGDETAWQGNSLMPETLVFVIAELSRLDKGKVFCRYRLPSRHAEQRVETVTLSAAYILISEQEDDLLLDCAAVDNYEWFSVAFCLLINLFMTHMHHKSNSHVLTPW